MTKMGRRWRMLRELRELRKEWHRGTVTVAQNLHRCVDEGNRMGAAIILRDQADSLPSGYDEDINALLDRLDDDLRSALQHWVSDAACHEAIERRRTALNNLLDLLLNTMLEKAGDHDG